jgi:hypothetical protein
MNIDEIETRPTVQKIYNLIGQEQIMSTYLFPVTIGKKYVNPFRDDRNPSCFFKWTNKGNLYFVDYATEQIYFSALDIAQLKTGYGFPDILYKIESDFQLNSLSMEEIKSLRVNERPPVEVTPSDIKTTVTYFKTVDLKYWEQYGIDITILDFYEVRKVERAWINGKLWYIKNDFDPCFRYQEKEKTKLYRPFANKKNKFRSNYFGGLLEGWNQLPPFGEELIITKGLKDCMTLYSCRINAVAVRSENTPISQNAFNLLKDRFKRIRLWYDNDEAGQIGCKKMVDLYQLECVSHDKDLPKDPSDIVKKLGKEKIYEIIK